MIDRRESVDGGSIYNSAENLSIDDCTLNNNAITGAVSEGGAIRNIRGQLTITDSTLSNSTAEGFSGAVRTVGGSISIRNTVIIGNHALNGTGVYWRRSHDLCPQLKRPSELRSRHGLRGKPLPLVAAI